jgi:predicted short-subunit dehydrogenase-like oxidoreductase (DUF2520 family)
VGTALGIAFARAGWPVVAVAGRDPARLDRFTRLVPGAQPLPQAVIADDVDLVLVTVPDDAIAAVAGSLRLYGGQAIVHTSGALPASVLDVARAAGTASGSFHPLVAVADPERAVADLQGATVAIEGDEAVMLVLSELATAIGGQPVQLPPGGKPAYHAAAMLAAGGFIGLLDGIAEIARGAGLDERGALAIYGPLVRQSLANAESLGIGGALTGPLARGDRGTVAGHLDAIARLAPGARELYLAVARREVALAESRGDLDPARATAIRALLTDR